MDDGGHVNRLTFDETTDNPFEQLGEIYHVLDYLGIKYIETINCEADDMIANYVHNYDETNGIVVSSFDSHFFN